MKVLSVEESKQVQLDLLEELDKFCTSNGINYSAAFGTLLGAIRHKGFIPWDDDIDVCLLRDDYIRFVTGYSSNGRYKVASLENDMKWNRPAAKFYDTRTLCNEESNNNTGIGLGIDIVPIDRIPSDRVKRKRYQRLLFLLRDIYDLKAMRLRKGRKLFKNISIVAGHILFACLSYRKLAQCINNYSQKYNKTDTLTLADNVEGYRKSEPYLNISFDKFIRVPFENCDISVMQGYDDVLTKDYGNYMVMPPADKQKSTHTFDIYWRD